MLYVLYSVEKNAKKLLFAFSSKRKTSMYMIFAECFENLPSTFFLKKVSVYVNKKLNVHYEKYVIGKYIFLLYSTRNTPIA